MESTQADAQKSDRAKVPDRKALLSQPAIDAPESIALPGLLPPGSRFDAPPLVRRQIRAAQRSAGNRAATSIAQRQVPPPAAAAPPGNSTTPGAPAAAKGPKGILDGVTLNTYTDAANLIRSRVALVAAEAMQVTADGGETPAILGQAQTEGQALADTAAAGGSTEIDDVTYEQASSWMDLYDRAMNAGEAARAMVVVGKLAAMRAAAEKGQKATAAAALQLADKQKAAYAGGDESVLSQLFNWSTALFDSGLAVGPLIDGCREMEQTLATAARAAAAQVGRGAKYKLPEAGTVMPIFENFNKAIAVYQLVQMSADLLATGKSGSAKAQTQVKAMVTIASAGGTLIGLASSMSIQINLYIGPMTDACLAALSKLEDVARKVNKDLIENGQYDEVNWVLEPGGRELFDYMRKVMAVTSAETIPQPIPAFVQTYFVDNREDISAGAAGAAGGKEGDEVPTTGFWFWRSLDEAKMAKWLFGHRANLWAIFYGSAKPGANN